MEFHAKEVQALTDAGADRGSPLSDAGRKHQRVQPAERGLRLVGGPDQNRAASAAAADGTLRAQRSSKRG